MKKSILCILALALLLCGCAVMFLLHFPRGYEYHVQEVTYSEPAVQYGFRVNMDCTETAYARYFFEQTIELAERSLCIESTDRILAGQGLFGYKPEVYVFTEDRYPCIYIDDHRLYLSVQEWQSVEYTTNVLLAACGAYSHYGLAYGYANYICDSPFPTVISSSLS